MRHTRVGNSRRSRAGIATVLVALGTAGTDAEPRHTARATSMRPRTGVEVSNRDRRRRFHQRQSRPLSLAAPRAGRSSVLAGMSGPDVVGLSVSAMGEPGWSLRVPEQSRVAICPPGTTAGFANSVSAGVYARLYFGSALGWKRIEPWISVGINPFSTMWATHARPTETVTNRFAIGVDSDLQSGSITTSRVARRRMLFQASPWVPFEACATARRVAHERLHDQRPRRRNTYCSRVSASESRCRNCEPDRPNVKAWTSRTRRQ